jgi:hypothetical protein
MHWHILPNDPATFQIPTRGLNPETGETDPESVGYDIYAPADGFLDALSRKLIPLGFRAEFANDHVGRYMDRSGMANKKTQVQDIRKSKEYWIDFRRRTHETQSFLP